MRNCKGSLLLLATLAVFSFPLIAEDKPANSASQVPATSVTTTQTNLSAPSSFDQVIDRVVARERAFNEQMRGLQPLVETRSEEHTSELQSHSFISYAV